MSKKIETIATKLIAGSIILGLAGCASLPSNTSVVSSIFTHTVETAPAELQLACANEAARQFQYVDAHVLPLRSERMTKNTFEVVLGFSNTKASCLINDQAEVIELQRRVL